MTLRRITVLALAALLAVGGVVIYRAYFKPAPHFKSSVRATQHAHVSGDGWGVELLGSQSKGKLTLQRPDVADPPWQGALNRLDRDDIEVGAPVKVDLSEGRLTHRGAVLTRRLDDPVAKGSRVALAYYDPHHDAWRSVPTKISSDRRTLTARVHHFSWWDSVEYGAGWLLDTRADKPECDGDPPEWVDDVTFLDDQNAPLRWCAGRDPKRPELVVLKLAVNRSYGVGVYPAVRPEWVYTELFGGGPEDFAARLLARAYKIPDRVRDVFGGEVPVMGGEEAHFAFTEEQIRSLAGRPAIRVSPDLKNALAGYTYEAIVKLGGFDDEAKHRKVAAIVALVGVAQCELSIVEPLRKHKWSQAAKGATECLTSHSDDIAKAAATILVQTFPKEDPKRLGKLAGKVAAKLWYVWAAGMAFQTATYFADRQLIGAAFEATVHPKIKRHTGPRPTPVPPSPTSTVAQAPPPSSNGPPTCNQFNAMSRSEQDQAIQALIDTYEDGSGSVSTTRFSAIAFCKLNRGRSIAGIYGGHVHGGATVTEIPTCGRFLDMNDADADAVLDYIAEQHGDDSSISTRRLSAAAFCRLNPDDTVDGIYGG